MSPDSGPPVADTDGHTREFGRIGRWRVRRCTYTDVVDAIPTRAMTDNTNSTGSTTPASDPGQ